MRQSKILNRHYIQHSKKGWLKPVEASNEAQKKRSMHTVHNVPTMQSSHTRHAAQEQPSKPKATPPAPDNTAPAAHLVRVYQKLVESYGEPENHPDNDPVGGLVATILSQHTSDINSGRAYQQLISDFPTWEAVRDAPTDAIANAIRTGGLANIKAPRIQTALLTLTTWQKEKGIDPSTQSLSEFLYQELMQLPLEKAWKYLQDIPGVGPKTASCVLLFNLGRPVMPIDTHLHRLTHRLGFIGPKVSADQAHVIFFKALPPEWAYALHVNLIRHGRTICHAQRPACDSCPLYSECAYIGSVDPKQTQLPFVKKR